MRRLLLLTSLCCAGCGDDFVPAEAAVLDDEQGARLASFGADPEPLAGTPVGPGGPVSNDPVSNDPNWPFPRVNEGHGTGAPAVIPSGPTPGQLERWTVAKEGDFFAPTFGNLSLEDVEVEDLLDALLYPDEYTEEERAFPEHIAAMDGQEVLIVGYQIPLEWKDRVVLEMMLVGDLMGCCFGGAPQPDQWLNVKMKKGKGCKYFPYLPVIVKGTLHIAPIEDEAGYAAGCYHIDAESVEKE